MKQLDLTVYLLMLQPGRALLTPRQRGSPLLGPSHSVWASELSFPVLCSIIKLISSLVLSMKFCFPSFCNEGPQNHWRWVALRPMTVGNPRPLPAPVWNMPNKKLKAWILGVSPIRENWFPLMFPYLTVAINCAQFCVSLLVPSGQKDRKEFSQSSCLHIWSMEEPDTVFYSEFAFVSNSICLKMIDKLPIFFLELSRQPLC